VAPACSPHTLTLTAPIMISRLFLESSCDHPYLHSFPTRRSSDLRSFAAKRRPGRRSRQRCFFLSACGWPWPGWPRGPPAGGPPRSEEHTSELQSRFDLVCRLLLEKKKKEKSSDKSR